MIERPVEIDRDVRNGENHGEERSGTRPVPAVLASGGVAREELEKEMLGRGGARDGMQRGGSWLEALKCGRKATMWWQYRGEALVLVLVGGSSERMEAERIFGSGRGVVDGRQK